MKKKAIGIVVVLCPYTGGVEINNGCPVEKPEKEEPGWLQVIRTFIGNLYR